jgi:PhnB protein
MRLITYLNFKGQCEEAFKFYAQSLGGKIETLIPFVGTPSAEHVPADWHNKIMHAHMIIGESDLLGSDAPPDRYEGAKGFHVTIQVKDTAEAERIFKALSEGGTVTMPIQQTFWAARFGMLVDKFGIPWMINCEQAS